MSDQNPELKLEDYVILPGRNHEDYEYPDTLVGTKLEKVANWSEAQLKLGQHGRFLPTIRQYLDFWMMLCEGNGLFRKVYLGNGKVATKEDLNRIKAEIIEAGFRLEPLDARFIVNFEGRTFMLFEHRYRNGLMHPNQIAEIDFSPFQSLLYKHYLKKFNKLGLPTKGGLVSEERRYFVPSDEAIEIEVHSRSYCPGQTFLQSKAVTYSKNMCNGPEIEYSWPIDKEGDCIFARPCRLKE